MDRLDVIRKLHEMVDCLARSADVVWTEGCYPELCETVTDEKGEYITLFVGIVQGKGNG